MKYKVHRLEVTRDRAQEILEEFLNRVNGEIVAVIPNVVPYLLCYGSKVDCVLVIEKTA